VSWWLAALEDRPGLSALGGPGIGYLARRELEEMSVQRHWLGWLARNGADVPTMNVMISPLFFFLGVAWVFLIPLLGLADSFPAYTSPGWKGWRSAWGFLCCVGHNYY
jgi:hypothetical protein